jgi:dTDP-4-dehydrorhamnose reductase
MTRPRVLLVGDGGQVGWELRRTLAPLAEVGCIDYPAIDLSNPESVRTTIRDAAPDIVINAAAYTAVDKAESEPAVAMVINAEAPRVMAEEAKRRGALFLHFSTDYVFDGSSGSAYSENDVPNPSSVYGRSKLAGDEAVQEVGGNHLIFRLCWVYGTRGRNFLLTIRRLAEEREEVRVVADQFGSPTWSRMIAETVAQVLPQVLAPDRAAALRGIYHLCASGQTSWHGFAQAIVDSMPDDRRRCRTVVAITTAEYPTPAARPARSVLCCDKLERVFGLRLPDWRHGLDLALAG